MDIADEVSQQQEAALKRLEELEAALEKQKSDIRTYLPPKPIMGAIVPGNIAAGGTALGQLNIEQDDDMDEVTSDGSGTEVLDGLNLLNDSADGV